MNEFVQSVRLIGLYEATRDKVVNGSKVSRVVHWAEMLVPGKGTFRVDVKPEHVPELRPFEGQDITARIRVRAYESRLYFNFVGLALA